MSKRLQDPTELALILIIYYFLTIVIKSYFLLILCTLQKLWPMIGSSDMEQFNMPLLKKLCKIDCTPAEEKEIEESLRQVLEYMDHLDEIDTSNVPPCRFVHPTLQKTLTRDDTVQDVLSRDKFLSNAPDQIGGMIRTPPVLKE